MFQTTNQNWIPPLSQKQSATSEVVKKQFHRLFGLKNIYMHSIGMGVHQSVQVVILGVKLLYFFWRYSSEPHIINVTNSFGKSNDPKKKRPGYDSPT